jgi:hypothetical protein
MTSSVFVATTKLFRGRLKTTRNDYESMSVNDVYLDWRRILDHKVSVRGRIQDLTAMYAIRDVDGGGMVFVDVSHAPRADRAEIIGCNMECAVTIRGTITTDFASVAPELLAERISKE